LSKNKKEKTEEKILNGNKQNGKNGKN